MLEINLNMYHATAIAAIVLLLGRFIVSKVPLLRNYCIPAPVVGGIAVSYTHLVFLQKRGFFPHCGTVFALWNKPQAERRLPGVCPWLWGICPGCIFTEPQGLSPGSSGKP